MAMIPPLPIVPIEHRGSLPPQPLRVAVTGHRALGDMPIVEFVRHCFYGLLKQMQMDSATGIVALSGLAEGADTLFAEAALRLHIPLEAGIAHRQLGQTFSTPQARARYQQLRMQCIHVYELPFAEACNAAYLALGHWLVNSCDVLLAAWNGLPAGGRGGTGDVVAYARQQCCPVVHIDAKEQDVSLLAT